MSVPELTFTEKRIVLLAASGKSTQEIARLVKFDEPTVEWHLSRANRKLDQMCALRQSAKDGRGR